MACIQRNANKYGQDDWTAPKLICAVIGCAHRILVSTERTMFYVRAVYKT